MRACWLTLLVATAAWAGPFSRVPAGDPLYRELRVIRDAGLSSNALVTFRDGDSLTRFECALLWNAAFDALRQRAAAGSPVSRPDPRVAAVCTALTNSLDSLRPELATLGAPLDTARLDLAGYPHRIASLDADAPAPHQAEPVGEPWLAGGSPWSGLRADSGGFSLTAGAEPLPWTLGGVSEEVGASLTAGLVGPLEGTVSWQSRELMDELGYGQSLSGHIVAADLRLRLGDQSVLVEYARSLMARRDGWRDEMERGQSIRAGYSRMFGSDLELDLAFRHLTSGFALLGGLGDFEEYPDLYGLEAGLSWRGNGFGVLSSAAVFRPEDQQVGYLNQLGTEVFYQPSSSWRLGLSYQTSLRRRLIGLEDAWRGYVRAQVVYELSDRMRADLSYHRRTSDLTAPGGAEHVIGASLGIGF